MGRTKTITYIGLYAALAMVMKFLSEILPILQMPQGGSIQLIYVVLFVASFHLGWKNGLLTALIAWLLGLLFGFNNWYVSPLQYILDYILPLAAVGGSALLYKNKQPYLAIIAGVLIAYLSTVISGACYWPPEDSYAGSLASWLFSLGYNLWYNLASLVVCLILVPLVLKALRRFNKEL